MNGLPGGERFRILRQGSFGKDLATGFRIFGSALGMAASASSESCQEMPVKLHFFRIAISKISIYRQRWPNKSWGFENLGLTR